MSLHHLAEQVRSAGRKNDKVLVHMTPNEVNGLQALALAHGGSLTINPHTGLPEADFLDAILPMAAGFLLAPLTAGTSLAFLGATPLASALTVGAVSGLATGSLEKGLMAGLGAYGGAGLGAGLSSGTAAAANTAAAPVGTASVANAPAASSYFGGQAMQGSANAALSGGSNLGYSALGTPAPLTTTMNAARAATTAVPVNMSTIPGASMPGFTPTPTPVISPTYSAQAFTAANPTTIQNQMALSQQAAANVPAVAQTVPTSSSMFSNYSMPKDLGTFYDKLPTGTLPALAVTGMQAMKPKQSGLGALPTSDSYLRPYEYSVEQDPEAYVADGSTRERVYFKEPRFKELPIQKAADGGLMDEPAGNVERMSEGNVVEMQRQEDNIPKYGLGGSAIATAQAAEPTSNVAYSYDPATMQYTSTTTAPPPPSQNSALNGPFLGGLFRMIGNSGGAIPSAGGGKGGLVSQLARQMPAPQPTVTTATSGGISTPFVPQGMSANAPMFTNSNIAPNINIPEQQTPEQQLGLQGFYQNMEKQLAAKGAQIMSQNMANGGVAGYASGGKSENEGKGYSILEGRIPKYEGPQDYGSMAKYAAFDVFAPAMQAIAGAALGRNVDPYANRNAALAMASDPQSYSYNPNSLEFLNARTGEISNGIAPTQGYADGGYTLGGYSDGGRLLKGPGDGVSDSIPAVIGDRQPARLADGEFVVPARIVSELGNGSTEAGAKKLYAMMNRVQNARKKSIGKGNVAVNSKAEKLLPA